MSYLFCIMLLITSISHTQMYTLKKQESLYKIAEVTQISVSDLRKLNDIYVDKVNAGQKLFIPSEILNYQVEKNDTFESIAKKFSIHIKYIITLNNISECYVIEGQKLRIPILKSVAVDSKMSNCPLKNKEKNVYKVVRGDTLTSIATKFHISVSELQKLNNKNHTNIFIGETLSVGDKHVVSSGQKNPVVNHPSRRGSYFVYYVKSGENLLDIAQRYKVSVNILKEINQKPTSAVHVGECLMIYNRDPILQQSQKKQCDIIGSSSSLQKDIPIIQNYKELKYVVQRSDNLFRIAHKFGVTPSEIKQWNHKNNDSLFCGEVLILRVDKLYSEEDKVSEKIPAAQYPNYEHKKMISYCVRQGDTLDRIAKKFNVSRAQLQLWNKKNRTHVYVGERLSLYIKQPTKVKTLERVAKINKKCYNNVQSVGIKSRGFQNIGLPVQNNQILSAMPAGRGVDLILTAQTSLKSPVDAKVYYAGYINVLQYVVILTLSENRTIVYTGLSSLDVKSGQVINKGCSLGRSSNNLKNKQSSIYMEMRDKQHVVNVMHLYKNLWINK